MASLTIRQLDPRTHARLRAQAAEHERSVEAEVRAILDAAMEIPRKNVLIALHESFAEVGGVDLAIPPREGGSRGVRFS